MIMEALLAHTRDIMRSRYAEMQQQNMGDSDPEAQRKDLYAQLKTFFPQLREKDMALLYEELEKQGAIRLLTHDIVTFSRSFVS